MFQRKILASALLMTAFFSADTFAFEFGKPMTAPIPVTTTNPSLGLIGTDKEVTIMSVILSDKEQTALNQRPTYHAAANSTLPSKVDLGMNGVPVLDQGRHGSCVTFAVSAALDAALGQGDYISQLCNLELGTHLEKNSYVPSGWSGSYGPIVLEQMMHFGIISKDTQRTISCAGMTEYPLKESQNQGQELTLVDYKKLSENLNSKLYWTHLLSNDQLFDWQPDPAEMNEVLTNVKKSLAEGYRVTFGTFLIIPENSCKAGACAIHNAKNDTWALTSDLDKPPFRTGGHEMVIMGYDDNAVAHDNDGKSHKGLLKLRNSWGPEVGDGGNFYMTYDYFVEYANEVQKIVPLASSKF